MPEVPSYGPAASQPLPQVKPEYLLMAAALMHEQGRFFQDQPQAPSSDVTKLLDQQIDFHKKHDLPTDKLEQQKQEWKDRMKKLGPTS